MVDQTVFDRERTEKHNLQLPGKHLIYIQDFLEILTKFVVGKMDKNRKFNTPNFGQNGIFEMKYLPVIQFFVRNLYFRKHPNFVKKFCQILSNLGSKFWIAKYEAEISDCKI